MTVFAYNKVLAYIVCKGDLFYMSSRTKQKSGLGLFIKVLLITTLILALIVAAGMLAWNIIVRPPNIPLLADWNWGNTPPNEGGEIIGEDGQIIDVGPAPDWATDDDRKPSFFTFLIMGLNEGTNVNTIMVASYDYVNREANLISIPRDSLINVNRNIRKLSSAYLVGSRGGRGRAGGVEQVQREVSTVIGFVPDFFFVIDYDAFFTIIDTIGGIEVYVPMRMRYTDPYQNLSIDIQPGLQHMDAQTALHFARFRQGDPGFPSPARGDYFRMESQQAIINAVIRELLRPSNLLRIPEFIDIFNASVYTDLPLGNMTWFAMQLHNIRGTDALSTYTMPVTGTSGAPMWYELLDAPGVVELVNRTINPFTRDITLNDVNIIRN